jgi:hypothetical protein
LSSFWVRFEFVFQPSSFVFNYFLSSFPLFFVLSHFLAIPASRQDPAIPRARSISGAQLRQCVHKLNTTIAYYMFVIMSSKRQVVVEFDGAAASLARQSAASAKSAKKARDGILRPAWPNHASAIDSDKMSPGGPRVA